MTDATLARLRQQIDDLSQASGGMPFATSVRTMSRLLARLEAAERVCQQARISIDALCGQHPEDLDAQNWERLEQLEERFREWEAARRQEDRQ